MFNIDPGLCENALLHVILTALILGCCGRSDEGRRQQSWRDQPVKVRSR